MHYKSLISGFAILAVAVAFVGCEKGTTEPQNSISDQDKNAIIEMMDNDDLFTSDATILQDGDPQMAKSVTGIIPFKWGRKITSVNRTRDFQKTEDSVVIVTVTTTISGNVWIRGRYSPQDTFQTFQKPFTETIVRKAKFCRVANTTIPRRNWMMRNISAAEGGTDNHLITINKVEFFVGDDTLTITNPLEYMMTIERLQRTTYNKGFRVQVTITSADTGNIVVIHRPAALLRSWTREGVHVVSSQNNGDGTTTIVYEDSWNGCWNGRHHIFVSAMTRQSIFDDNAAFASRLWGIPYIIQ